jgi:hypothetical protein
LNIRGIQSIEDHYKGLQHLTIIIHSNHGHVTGTGNDQAIAAPGERMPRMPPHLHITRQTATAAVSGRCHCWFVHIRYIQHILQPKQNTNTPKESLQTTRTATASRQPQHQTTSTSPAVAPVPPQDAFSFANNAVASIAESNNRKTLEEQTRNIARGVDRKGLEMQQIRRWNVGDVYAPHDLSGVEQSKWKRLKQSPRPKWDVLDQLNLNPMDHYKVCWVEVWGEGRVEMQKLTERLLPELQHHVRIRYGDGQDQAQQGHRPATTQPA